MPNWVVLLPAVTRDLPILILTGASSMYHYGDICLQLDFSPEEGTHDESELAFCGGPVADPDNRDDDPAEEPRAPGYGATVGSSGRYVDGGLRYCGLSHGELQLEWLPAAARELDLPPLTVVELRVSRTVVTEVLAPALRLLFEREMPDRPLLELRMSCSAAHAQLELPLF